MGIKMNCALDLRYHRHLDEKYKTHTQIWSLTNSRQCSFLLRRREESGTRERYNQDCYIIRNVFFLLKF